MTQPDFFSKLAVAVSGARIAPYRSGHIQSGSEAYGTYAWNIALCESLYPALNCLEVSLRNSIHEAATREFGVANWLLSRLHRNELEPLTRLSNDLGRKLQPNGINDLIANLNLGFWISLFRRRYEQVLWPKLLEPVFPHCSKSQLTRQNVYARLDKIRLLRNRVFHHEPVWNWVDLPEQHALTLETIGWISPAILEMTILLDRFPGVYTEGTQQYEIGLDSAAQSWVEAEARPGG